VKNRFVRAVVCLGIVLGLISVAQISDVAPASALAKTSAKPVAVKKSSVVNGIAIDDHLLAKYQSIGGVAVAGNPTDVAFTTAPRTGIDGVWQTFENGTLFWSDATGAHWVFNGAILDEFFGCGFFCYGMPSSDTLYRAKGAQVLMTQYGGNFYWSAATGVQQIYGPVLNKYSAMGGTTSFLGLPTSSIQSSSDWSVQWASFEWGSIFWSDASGAHEIHGAIRAKWNSLGGQMSSLGLPTSDEHKVAGGRQSDFENGSIFWNASTNKVTVILS